MRIDEGDFVGTDAEFAALAGLVGAEQTRLSLVPVAPAGDADRASARAFAEGLPPALRTTLDEAVGALAAPSRVVRLHYAIGEESVARCGAALTPRHPGSAFLLGGTAAERRLSVPSHEATVATVRNVLAADGLDADATAVFGVSTPAAVVLLAALEFLRAARLVSLLEHTAPVESFSVPEILDRLGAASTEDFRWPLLFFEKVLPVAVPRALSEDDVRAALAELEREEVVARVEGPGPELWALREAGEILADAVAHDVSKAAVGVAGIGEDGVPGHECALFLRSARHLFVVDVRGEKAFVGALAGDDLTALLERLLDASAPPLPTPAADEPVPTLAPEPEPVAPAAGAPAAADGARRFCTGCGAAVSAGSRFCAGCGRPAPAPAATTAGPKPCAKCGAPPSPGAKFCVGCGAPAA